MLPKIVTRRAEEARVLLDRGAFVGLQVPLGNGGTLPAEMFAKIALDDLDRLSALNHQGDGEVSGMSWRRLAAAIELLHEVALAHGRANTEADRVHG